MPSREGFVDQSTALFQELDAQLEDFQLDRFRNFYFNYIGKDLDRRQLAESLAVDFAASSYTFTVPTCQLKLGVFATPADKLLDQKKQFTGSALGVLESMRLLLERMTTYHSSSQIPYLNSGYSMNRVSVTLFIGRRSLGSRQYEDFLTRALDFVGFSSDEYARVSLNVRSFDTIVDDAMSFGLEPFPFRNQELLKTILARGGESVREKALTRLDRTIENAPIFERYLSLDGPIESAVAGARDVEKLKALMAQLSDRDWQAEFVQTRISILQNEFEAIEAATSSRLYFGTVYQALEAIDDEAALERISQRITGDTPRDVGSRLIIAAKRAYRAGDAAKIDEAIQEAADPYSHEVEHVLIRLKLRLEAEQKTAPEVFISYRHESEEHREWVRKFAEDLRRNGINALLDQWELNLGDSIADFGAAAIFRARAMLFLITPASVTAVEADDKSRSVVKFEFQLANARRYKDGNFRIIGILRGGERPPNHLADTLYLDFRRNDDYEMQLSKLIRDLLGESDRPGVRSMMNTEGPQKAE